MLFLYCCRAKQPLDCHKSGENQPISGSEIRPEGIRSPRLKLALLFRGFRAACFVLQNFVREFVNDDSATCGSVECFFNFDCSASAQTLRTSGNRFVNKGDS
jgi:hypothetical protein